MADGQDDKTEALKAKAAEQAKAKEAQEAAKSDAADKAAKAEAEKTELVLCTVKGNKFHAIQNGKRIAVEKGGEVEVSRAQLESFKDVLEPVKK